MFLVFITVVCSPIPLKKNSLSFTCSHLSACLIVKDWPKLFIMHNQNKDIKSILKRYRQGNASDEEIAFLENWYILNDHSDPSSADYTAQELIEDTDQLWKKLNRRPPTFYKIIKYAAAVLIVTSLILYWQWPTQQDADLVMENIIATDNQEPTITLSDGTIIPLDQQQSGIKMGTDIRYENGNLVTDLQDGKKAQELFIQIPPGRTYHLILSDNTKVWLNAGSSLRYPSFFEGDLRTVKLKGEAYFEVSSQKQEGHIAGKHKGFMVKTDKQVVHVMGTHFNVNAYSDTRQRTTLLEGKVQIATSENSPYATLKPGQEAIVENTRIILNDADTERSISWISGLFSFDNKPFEEIMREVGDWYNLKVVYAGKIPEDTFFGQAYKSDNLATVLQLLESVQIQYRVTSDRKLIITNKKTDSKNMK